jgi:glycosyltransferase involved in cell wall biosynthesis
MRILISSNGPATPTGYGTQGKGLLKALKSLGHELDYYAWYGLEGGIIGLGDGVKMYPRIRHPYGGDAGMIASEAKSDLVIALQDIWPLPVGFTETVPVPWLGWFPIDGDPMSPPVQAMAETCPYPVVYSQHGEKVCRAAGLDAYYIPLAIDTDVFSPGDKLLARQKLGIPADKFMVSMVAANKGYPCRKSFPEALAGFKAFHDLFPDSFLYMHTEKFPRGSGIDLADLMRLVGLSDDVVKFVNVSDYLIGLSDDYLADVYRASDVLLAPSMGEGFGLPILEAQACGCPVITQDITSMSEITLHGVAIEPLQPFYSPLGVWHYIASIPAIAEALAAVHDGHETPEWKANAQMARSIIVDTYSWPAVTERHWKPMLDKIADDLGLDKPQRTQVSQSENGTRDKYLTRDDLKVKAVHCD